MKVRRKITPLQTQINDLKDEIQALRKGQDSDVSVPSDKPPRGSGNNQPNRPFSGPRFLFRVGGRALPLISAAVSVADQAVAAHRAGLIAAAQQELARLEQELEGLKREEKARESDLAEKVRILKTCEAANKRQ